MMTGTIERMADGSAQLKVTNPLGIPVTCYCADVDEARALATRNGVRITEEA